MTKHIKGYLLWIGNDQDRKPVLSTSKMNEVKVKALGMIVSTSAKFNRSTITSIDMCVDKIDFMIQYNPCPINPKKHKKDYHEFWDAVKKELLAIRNIYQ